MHLGFSSFRCQQWVEFCVRVKAYACAGQIGCKQLVKSSANGWSNPCNYAHQGFSSLASSYIIGEHVQAHLGAYPVEFSRQEVRRPHPLFECPEGMLNRPFSDSHHLWCFAQPMLHLLQYVFMLSASNSSFRARCALRFQRAALAFPTPVTMQFQAFFNVGIVPDQRLSSRANVFVFSRVIEEGIVIETPVSLGSRGHRLGRIGGDACIVASQVLFAFEVTSVSHYRQRI